jgi:Zn-dependent protease
MGDLLSGFNLQNFILTISVLILGITLHEFAHAIAADRLGDPTPRRQGRISILPPDHLDPVGTIMMVITTLTGFGIGWGKPVMTNPSNFRKPRRDQGLVALAGPVSNLIQAVVFSLLLRGMAAALSADDGNPAVVDFLYLGVTVNLALAFFNLIPLAPLDGSWIMTAILPAEQAVVYQRWMLMYGQLVFLLLVFMFRGVFGMVIGPPVAFVEGLLLHGITL